MKVPVRAPLNRNESGEEKSDYANYRNTRIITLFQVPHYDQLQILICNDNSLTTLAGVEHIKHLWKLDVSNNQIRSLQHLSRFIAFGSLNLANNRLQWIELQYIRHMFILDLRLDGNAILDADPNYRQHVLDCLPRLWMFDGIFVSTSERNHMDEFFTQSSLTQKPVRHKLARDIFMPTNLKDRAVNGLFGSKAMDLFAKFPMNCFVNADLDKRRIKHLASTIQDLYLSEMRHEDRKKEEEVLMDNRHILYHMMDIRQSHVEEFNMFLILLLTDLIHPIPVDLLNDILKVTRLNTIENLKIPSIFASSEQMKCTIASLIHAGTRLDRDENHSSAFYDKLFQSLSLVLTNQIRQLCATTNSQPYPNSSVAMEAKTVVCLEVMQVFIMCPVFYTMITNSNVCAILQQALDRSPAYESIRNVLESLNVDEKTAEEQKDLLGPLLGNIIKMTIRTLSTKRTKKNNNQESTPAGRAENDTSSKREPEQNGPSPRSAPRPTNTHRIPTIGDRVLTAPQTFGRIVTIPDADIAMVQFDHILAINGSMITHGSLNDHTNYVSMNQFQWDSLHEYWKPKFTHGDKITLHMSTTKNETPRTIQSSVRPLTGRPSETTVKARPVQIPLEINMRKPKEAFVDPPRPVPPPIIEQEEHPSSEPNISQEMNTDRPMSVRITKQNQESNPDETTSASPVLIESMLLLMPEQSQPAMVTFEQRGQPVFSNTTTSNDFEHSSSLYRRATHHATQRVPVPVHNASVWFNGPDMQNERSERMEKVVSSLVRRSFRPISNYTMPRVPNLTSPSSRDHALSKGVRPGPSQDFCIESQRLAPNGSNRYASAGRSYDLNRTYHSSPNVYRMKSLGPQPCPTPLWMRYNDL